MVGLKKLLLEEKKQLEKIIEERSMQMENVPEGTLRVSTDKEYTRYYKCTEESKSGIYLRKKDLIVAQGLAQKEYNGKILKTSQKRLRQITDMLKDYEDDEIEQCFYREHVAKQKPITPIEQTYEHRIMEWQNQTYEGKSFGDNTMEIYTQKGERVRSKSEKTLADYFYYHGIPYKYECPLLLKGFGIIYPDFTFLTRRSQKEMGYFLVSD